MSGSGLDEVIVELGLDPEPVVDKLGLHLAQVLNEPELDVQVPAGQLGLQGESLRFVRLLVPEDVQLHGLEGVLGLKSQLSYGRCWVHICIVWFPMVLSAV